MQPEQEHDTNPERSNYYLSQSTVVFLQASEARFAFNAHR